jgi:hypothetical protein
MKKDKSFELKIDESPDLGAVAKEPVTSPNKKAERPQPDLTVPGPDQPKMIIGCTIKPGKEVKMHVYWPDDMTAEQAKMILETLWH